MKSIVEILNGNTDVDEKELLDDIILILNDDCDYLKIIIDHLDEQNELCGSLRLLERDITSLNNVIQKYLYDK